MIPDICELEIVTLSHVKDTALGRPYSSSNEVGIVLTRRLPLQLQPGSDIYAIFSLTLSSQEG